MNSINLIGAVASAPEGAISKHSNVNLASFRVAVSQYKDQPTLFLDVTCAGPAADYTMKYCLKGDLLAVTGRLTYDEWDKADGSKGRKYGIFASSVEIVRYGKNHEPSAATKTQAQENRANASKAKESEPLKEGFDENDDLPF